MASHFTRRFTIATMVAAALAIVAPLSRLGAVAAAPPSPPPAARPDATAALPAAPSEASLAALRTELAATEGLDEATRAAAVAALDRVRAKLTAIAEWTDRASRAEQGRAAAAAELPQVKADLAALKDPSAAAAAAVSAAVQAAAGTPDAESPKAARQKLEEAGAALALAKEKVAEVDRDIKQRADRRAALPAEIGRAVGDLDELAATPEVAAADRSPVLVAIDRAERGARAAELRSRLEALRAEQAAIDDRAELDALLKERAAKRVAVREAEAHAWQRRIDAAVSRDAEREALDARRETAQGVAPVRAVSRKTLELIEQRTGDAGLIARNADTRRRLDLLATRLPALAAEYDRERLRAASTGTSGLTSARLRLQRAQLPDARYLDGVLARGKEDLFTTQRRQAELEAEIAALPSPTEERDALLAAMDAQDGAMAPELRSEIAAELDRRILDQRRQYDLLLAAYREREELLLRAMDGLPGFIAIAEHFSAFIDQRILWIRSVEPIGPRDLDRCWATFTALVASVEDVVLGGELLRAVDSERLVFGVIGVLVIAWFATIGRRRRHFSRLAEQTSRFATDGMKPTLVATALTAIQAFFWPCIILFACSRLGMRADASPGLQAMIAGVQRAMLGLLVLLPMLALVRTNGLGSAHFGWRDETRRQLRRWLRRLGVVLVPMSFIVGATEWSTRDAGSDLLGRLAFVISALAVAATFAVLLRPGRGVLTGVVANSRSPWTQRLEPLWRLLAIATPVAQGMLAALGWYYTALQLNIRLAASLGLVVAVIFAHAFVTRWLLLSKRRMAVAEMRKRREALRAAEEPGQAASAEGGSVPVEETAPSMASIDAQTRQLLRTAVTFTLLLGMWAIWAKVLPALDGFNRFELWPNFGQVREVANLPPPSSAILNSQRLPWIPPPPPAGSPGSAPTTGASTSGSPAPAPGESSAGAAATGAAAAVPAPSGTGASPSSVGTSISPTAPAGAPATGSSIAPSATTGGAPAAPPLSAPSSAGPATAPSSPVASGTPPVGSSAAAPIGQSGGQSASATISAGGSQDEDARLTLGNLVGAIIILIATIAVARNSPGLLEISILQRLPVENSVRYAITTLTSYAVWGIGITATFAAVGIGWSKVQWLVAAASVGIGFGLQEIVANLISGIIILFEQPVRVGDTVTVNGVSGTVSRIRIRATTITDWDRKELIIPNKTFITGQVINWTLSDAALRVVVPVGVDYGADPHLVVRLLREIGAANPIVLREPAPAAVFVAFGESTLAFELRVVVPSVENLSAVRHELHMAIADRFRAEKINIAFPQRDVHLTGALELAPRPRAAR